MKKSNQFINQSVYNTNLKYVKLQNQTKELFFRCLDEEEDLEYFEDKLKKIWGNISHKFMDDDIEEYTEIIHEENMQGKEVVEDIPRGAIATAFALTSMAVMQKYENKMVKEKTREYKVSLNSPAYKNDKQIYLKEKVQRYNSQIVPYYHNTATGEVRIRRVDLSTYVSMIHNTNMTRSAWNATLRDAMMLGQTRFWIPPHPFACSDCVAHQGYPMSEEEVAYIADTVDEKVGDVLHPNCKCTLEIYYDDTVIPEQEYSPEELDEQYHIRQKVNSLTLKKERLQTDINIQKRLGNMDEVDKLNQQRNKINSQIREQKDRLPTESLQKQVVAINR